MPFAATQMDLETLVLSEVSQKDRNHDITYAVMCLVTRSCPTICSPMDCSTPGSFVHRDSPGHRTGVGCYALLQGIFPTQGSNLGLPHCRKILYHLSYQGIPISLTCGISNTIQMHLSMKKKQTHRHREQTCGCQEGGQVGGGMD